MLVLALLAGASPLACAGILGDFSIGESASADAGTDAPTQPTADGSGDGAQDSSNVQDGPSQDAPGTDANDAGGQGVALNCAIQGGSAPILLGQIPSTQNNYDLAIFNASPSPGQVQFRVAVQAQGSQSTYHVYSFGNGSSSAGDIPVPAPNPFTSIVRYPTGLATVFSGYAAQSDGGPGQQFLITTLPDNQQQWTQPNVIVTADALPSCMNDLNGSLFVNDAANQDYYLVWAYQDCADHADHVAAEHYTGPTSQPVVWPLPPGDAGAQRFSPAGIAPVGTNVYVLMNGGNNGPTPGVGPTLYSSVPNLSTVQTFSVPLVNPTDIMDGYEVQPTNGGQVGVAILEANLSSTTIAPTIYAGSIATSLMANLTPASDLPATALPGLSNVPGINGGRAHWESFVAAGGTAASDNLLMAGAEFPNANGLDVIWWNGAGKVLSNKSGSGAYFYFDTSDGGTGLSIYGGDITFSSQPLPALAQFEMAYLQQNATPTTDASSAVNVWASSVDCTP